MRYQNALLVVAESLLYAEQSEAMHAEVLRSAFLDKVSERQIAKLAARTLASTATRPSPRLKALARQLFEHAGFQRLLARHALKPGALPLPPRMRVWSGCERLPRLETIGELAAWLHIDVGHLHWLADLNDRNRRSHETALHHYHCKVIEKRDGRVRLLESPKQHLKHVQRQILHEVLNAMAPHDAAHGFRKGCSVVTFAQPHCGKRAVFRLDLEDFFPSISGSRVQAMFRTLGYPERVADLLGGLCTTTTSRLLWNDVGVGGDAEEQQRLRVFYARPHLPQGAPTSPAIANLCALKADRRLTALAKAANASYTRYADDLAFSGDATFARSANRFAARAAAILHEEGFVVNHRKTKYMQTSTSQRLAGLTVNAAPNLPREELDRLKAILTNCVRYGPATQNRERYVDFRRHLEGSVSYVSMVNPKRAAALRRLFEQIFWN